MGYVRYPMHYLVRSLWAVGALGACAAGFVAFGQDGVAIGQDGGPPVPGAARSQADDVALTEAFQLAGIQIDRDAGVAAFSARIEVLNELLEYLLVSPHGAVHESLFVTDVDPEVLQAAMLTVGAELGENVQYIAKDPPPTREEVRSGIRTHDVVIPKGKPVYMYAAWREGAGPADPVTGALPDETLYFHRMEDLILDLTRGRTMRRHGWVWLGSRMVPDRQKGKTDVFAASATGNLACIAYFSQGDTLLTPALPECTSQTSWRPNVWMLPDRGDEVLLVLSTKRLDVLPDGLLAAIPFVDEPDEDGADDSGLGR